MQTLWCRGRGGIIYLLNIIATFDELWRNFWKLDDLFCWCSFWSLTPITRRSANAEFREMLPAANRPVFSAITYDRNFRLTLFRLQMINFERHLFNMNFTYFCNRKFRCHVTHLMLKRRLATFFWWKHEPSISSLSRDMTLQSGQKPLRFFAITSDRKFRLTSFFDRIWWAVSEILAQNHFLTRRWRRRRRSSRTTGYRIGYRNCRDGGFL